MQPELETRATKTDTGWQDHDGFVRGGFRLRLCPAQSTSAVLGSQRRSEG